MNDDFETDSEDTEEVQKKFRLQLPALPVLPGAVPPTPEERMEAALTAIKIDALAAIHKLRSNQDPSDEIRRIQRMALRFVNR